MNKLIRILIASVGLVAPAFATIYGGSVDTVQTTLSTAIAANTTQQVCVASATGINVNSISQAGSYLMIGREAFVVTTAGASSTCFNVKRAQLGTSGNYGHPSGDAVWVGNVATGTGDSSHPFSGGAITANVPNGSCVASAQYSLPLIIAGPPNNAFSGQKAYCFAGVWTLGVSTYKPYTTFTTISPPNPIATTSVSDVAGKEFFGQLYVPSNATITGLCVLNGATVGTDKWILALWDAAGNVLGNTALAGTTTAVASKYQCIALVAPINLTGAGSYFVGVQGNGTTDNFQAYATGGVPTNYATGTKTGGAFGTITAIVPTTTFTTALGPLMMTY